MTTPPTDPNQGSVPDPAGGWPGQQPATPQQPQGYPPQGFQPQGFQPPVYQQQGYPQAGQVPLTPGMVPAAAQVQPQAAPAPKKSFFARHKVLTVLGALVLLGIVIGVFSSMGGDDSPKAVGTSGATAGASAPADADAQADAGAKADTAKLGQVVSEGGFDVTITKVKPGVKEIGENSFTTKPQGQFVVVDVTAKNTGNKAEYFFGSQIKLIDTAGREHSTDTGAQIYLGDMDAFMGEVNPGNTVKGSVVFDVPTDAEPAFVQLSGDLFSDGAKISVN